MKIRFPPVIGSKKRMVDSALNPKEGKKYEKKLTSRFVQHENGIGC